MVIKAFLCVLVDSRSVYSRRKVRMWKDREIGAKRNSTTSCTIEEITRLTARLDVFDFKLEPRDKAFITQARPNWLAPYWSYFCLWEGLI